MRLLTPNDKEVEEFKRLCKEQLGVELTDEEALEAATTILQVFVLSDGLSELYGDE